MDKTLIHKNISGYVPWCMLAYFVCYTAALALRHVYPALSGILATFAYAALIAAPVVVLTAKTPPKRLVPQPVLFALTVWGLVLIAAL
jgi:hypothetical protein